MEEGKEKFTWLNCSIIGLTHWCMIFHHERTKSHGILLWSTKLQDNSSSSGLYLNTHGFNKSAKRTTRISGRYLFNRLKNKSKKFSWYYFAIAGKKEQNALAFTLYLNGRWREISPVGQFEKNPFKKPWSPPIPTRKEDERQEKKRQTNKPSNEEFGFNANEINLLKVSFDGW